MITENWKPIDGFEGSYEVSDLGRVRSLDREVTMLSRWGKPVTKRLRGRLLSLHKNPKGYPFVFLGGGNIRPVHRLVAHAFVPGEGPVVNHLNGIRDDNRAVNLEWTTVSGNNLHAFRELRRAPTRTRQIMLTGDSYGMVFPSIRAAAQAMGWSYQSLYWALNEKGAFKGWGLAYV